MSTTSMAIISNPLFATYSVYACNASIYGGLSDTWTKSPLLMLWLSNSMVWNVGMSSKWIHFGMDALDRWCLPKVAGQQMVPTFSQCWSLSCNSSTTSHLSNPNSASITVRPYCSSGWQCRCHENTGCIFTGGLEETTRISLNHMAEDSSWYPQAL